MIQNLFLNKMGHFKLGVRWVSKMLTENHKHQSTEMGQEFLARYAHKGNHILGFIVRRNRI